jgi:DNA-binding CsgD family transcriptional regulator
MGAAARAPRALDDSLEALKVEISRIPAGAHPPEDRAAKIEQQMLSVMRNFAQQCGVKLYAIYDAPADVEAVLDFQQGRTFQDASVPHAYWNEFWPFMTKNGPSVLAQEARATGMRFTWRTIREKYKRDKKAVEIFDLMEKNGLRDGYRCPVGTRWIIDYWTPGPWKVSSRECDLLYYAAIAAAERLEVLYPRWRVRGGNSRGLLTLPQVRALREYSKWRPADEIGAIMGVTPKTVYTHLRDAARKLGAKDSADAVRIARRKHLL